MIEIGKYNTLTILRHTSVGLYLGDEEGEDVLLPNKYCPTEYEIGDKLTVFVYHDYAERKVATNITPKILMDEFTLLQVSDVTEVGAFMNWGLEKDLLVPFREQRQKMEEGRWYIIYMDVDDKTDRLYGTNKIDKLLQNYDLSVEVGEEVDITILTQTDLGYSVIVNNAHKGLIFDNEIFKDLNIGDKLKGFVKNIREDNKIDISLQAIGYANFSDANSKLLMDLLQKNKGVVNVTDKSAPDVIYSKFGISKKAFKKALGALYKQHLITIEDDCIKLVQQENDLSK